MTRFQPAFEKMLENEGGYQLHHVPGDRGGRTYAGISERSFPDWAGWKILAEKTQDQRALEVLTQSLYLNKFWKPIQGNYIKHQQVANSLFDFAVNTGVPRAVRLAQIVVGAHPDGVMGPKTLEALNSTDPHTFQAGFMLAKIDRYRRIAAADPSQRKFLLGWINRVFEAK